MDITDLTMALGTYQASTLEATAAYSVFPRGGLYVAPTFVRRIQDAQGATVQRSLPLCDSCLGMLGASKEVIPEAPGVAAKQALGGLLDYQMVTMMEGVVQRGTATALRSLGRPLAGKTGTTNDYVDAWFVGFSPTLTVGVWVGKDSPTSLGYGETGGKAALPIWKMFMQRALADQPNTSFAVPQGIEFVKIDADSGLLPGTSTEKTLLEAFVPGTAPTTVTPWLGDDGFGATPEGEGGGEGRSNFNFFGIF
jgi:penicillin-binding protein 1A